MFTQEYVNTLPMESSLTPAVGPHIAEAPAGGASLPAHTGKNSDSDTPFEVHPSQRDTWFQRAAAVMPYGVSSSRHLSRFRDPGPGPPGPGEPGGGPGPPTLGTHGRAPGACPQPAQVRGQHLERLVRIHIRELCRHVVPSLSHSGVNPVAVPLPQRLQLQRHRVGPLCGIEVHDPDNEGPALDNPDLVVASVSWCRRPRWPRAMADPAPAIGG